MALGAQSEAVRRVYEGQIEEASREMEAIQPTTEIDLAMPYRTALGKVKGLLKSPYSIWQSVDTAEKHRLFFFLFEAKLVYDKKEGYRTGDLLSTTRLFEELVASNSSDVVIIPKSSDSFPAEPRLMSHARSAWWL